MADWPNVITQEDGAYLFSETDLPSWQYVKKKPIIIKARRMPVPFTVKTAGGPVCGKAGDWLAQGINGELYPIEDAIFVKTHLLLVRHPIVPMTDAELASAIAKLKADKLNADTLSKEK